FLRHLCADWDTIRATFAPESHPGILEGLQGGAGDTHRGGKTVMIARFSSGLKVVYKPKSMNVARHFQELLDWLNERGDHPPFRTVKIFPCGDYGWVEFVEAQGCSSTSEVERFYERQGGYLALLNVLQANDLHHENLIAAGEHPILIDLETLFHPRFGRDQHNAADSLVHQIWAHSVLRIGLLPQRFWANDEHAGVDISGLGGSEGQFTPSEVPQWEDVGTDQMQLIRKRIRMEGSQNRPSLDGTAINPLDYIDAIVTGFTSVYRLLLSHRSALLADDGPNHALRARRGACHLVSNANLRKITVRELSSRSPTQRT
ncbi:type 2 lantipeptide synthetase LanM, partial [Chloroflexi bacterium TSY]|nr:type 2 lantipeptide synthetase LanM [Chloroflexi bacterium TSY]